MQIFASRWLLVMLEDMRMQAVVTWFKAHKSVSCTMIRNDFEPAFREYFSRSSFNDPELKAEMNEARSVELTRKRTRCELKIG